MLSLNNVCKQFGAFKAVDHLNLKITTGGIWGLLGPNGAGKTTLLKMIMGLLPPTSGKILLFDTLKPTDKLARQKVGYMPQQLAVYPGLTVEENIYFFGRLYGVDGKRLVQQTDQIINLTELEEKKDELITNLSGGMVRRTMMATVLIHNPSLVILDEPTAGVDPLLRLKFWQWFQQLAQQGISILVTTHHIAEANHCDEVFFLREGCLIEQGAPQTLMDHYESKNLEDAFVKATQRVNSPLEIDHDD